MVLMHNNQRGFTALLVIIPLLLVVMAGAFVLSTQRNDHSAKNIYKVTAPNSPELTHLVAPYAAISDLASVGPYSSNQAVAGYVHQGIDFMADHDMVEYRSISSGIVAEVKIMYDTTRSDTHPQVNIVVLYNPTTKIVYTFEPYSRNVADAERQLTLMSIKEGDALTAGQPLGRLIKTAPQSHVHIHVMKNEKEFCFEPLFADSDKAEMLTKALSPLNQPKELCYE